MEKLHLFLLKRVHIVETTTSDASRSKQMYNLIHANHIERTVPALQSCSFILSPAFRLCTFVFADEAGQELLSRASLFSLFVCFFVFSGWTMLQYFQPLLAVGSGVALLWNIQPQPLPFQQQSFRNSVPDCLEDETLMIPLRIVSH